ncbi:MAG: SBBP repeat-containing protein [Acidobacteriota bacterium]
MRIPVVPSIALFLSTLVSAQVFPPTVDLSKSISILQTGMQVQQIAVDATGNVYLAGVSSSGFTGATTRIGPRGSSDLFVIKTNSAADQIIYATAIGGSESEALRAIRVDAAGNVYLLGSTLSEDFPATVKANPTFPIGSVAVKLNPAGTALTYSTQLGSRMTALALDIDASGAAYIAGSTNSRDLPATAGVLKPSPAAGTTADDYLGFIIKLAPAGDTVQLATYFGEKDRYVEAVAVRTNSIVILSNGTMATLDAGLAQQTSSINVGINPARIAFDSTGNIYVAGTSLAAGGGFALKKYAAVGQAVLLDKTYPLVSTTVPPRMAVTSTGRIYLFGQPAGINFPTKNATQACLANIAAPNGIAGLPGADASGGLIGAGGGVVPPDQALMILGADGAVLHATFITTNVAQAAVAPTSGRIYTAATQTLFTLPDRTAFRGVVRFNQDIVPTDKVSPSCLVHGASFNATLFSPGAIMTIFGDHLGPAAFTSFQLVNNLVPATLAGVSVTVDGKPAPMLFTYDKQINFIVPWSLRTDGTAVPVCVTYDGATTCLQVGTTVAVPGAFQRGAITAALNGDNTVHELTNPAARGSVVQLFMTGFGQVEGNLVDGGVSVLPLQHVEGTVTATAEATTGGGCGIFACAGAAAPLDAPVGFAGAAPSLVQGVTQVNITIPLGASVGASQPYTISFKPVGATTALTAQVFLSIK